GLLMIALGVLWLVVLAFQVSLLWGVGGLFAPVLLVFVARYWGIARKAGIFSALGLVPLVAGFAQLASLEAARGGARLSGDWLFWLFMSAYYGVWVAYLLPSYWCLLPVIGGLPVRR